MEECRFCEEEGKHILLSKKEEIIRRVFTLAGFYLPPRLHFSTAANQHDFVWLSGRRLTTTLALRCSRDIFAFNWDQKPKGKRLFFAMSSGTDAALRGCFSDDRRDAQKQQQAVSLQTCSAFATTMHTRLYSHILAAILTPTSIKRALFLRRLLWSCRRVS